MFAVVEVHEDGFRGQSVRVFGPYPDLAEAERKRRNRHLTHALKQTINVPRTYVATVEERAE